MKWRVSLLPKAVDDITHARDWYAQKSPGLADVFLDDVAWAMRELGHAPELPRLYFRTFRRVLLRRFPYKIFYQVIGGHVVVFRALHGRQKHESALGDRR